MKFLDYLFHGKELKAIGNYFKMLNGYSPTFTSFSGGVYEMDLTRTAINNFATHCSKLKPEIEGSALKSLEKTLQHKPNYFMDTTKFIKRLATYVAVEHTASDCRQNAFGQHSRSVFLVFGSKSVYLINNKHFWAPLFPFLAIIFASFFRFMQANVSPTFISIRAFPIICV